MPQEVVIIGADGKEHVFPPGFSPKRAAAIVRERTGNAQIGFRDVLRGVGMAGGPTGGMAAGLSAMADIDPETATGALPSIGGAIGGIGGAFAGGPPGAIGGAAAGGAMGDVARRTINAARGNPDTGSMNQQMLGVVGQGVGQGAMEAAGGAVGAAMKPAAKWLMQSALKPTQAVLKEYSTTPMKLVTSLLEEGVNVTEGGLAKLQRLFADTNQEIASRVRNAPGVIDKKAVAARAANTANKMAQQVNPTKDLETVGTVVDEFMNHPIYSGPTMRVPEAQAMKVGTYQQIGKKYGQLSSAEVETQKALARGLKEDVADAVPGLNELNQRDSRLMADIDAVGRRVAVANNRDPVGFAWVTQNPATFLAALLDRSPAVKSLLARGLYRAAGTAAGVSPQLIRIAVTSLATDQPQQPPGGGIPPE